MNNKNFVYKMNFVCKKQSALVIFLTLLLLNVPTVFAQKPKEVAKQKPKEIIGHKVKENASQEPGQAATQKKENPAQNTGLIAAHSMLIGAIAETSQVLKGLRIKISTIINGSRLPFPITGISTKDTAGCSPATVMVMHGTAGYLK